MRGLAHTIDKPEHPATYPVQINGLLPDEGDMRTIDDVSNGIETTIFKKKSGAVRSPSRDIVTGYSVN